MKKFSTWFNGLKTISKVAFISALVVIFLGVIGASAEPNSSTQNKPNDSSTSAPTVQKTESKIEVKTETTTEVVPYTSSTVEDSSLALGLTQTHTTGSNGVLTHTYQVTYTNGIETSRSAAVDAVTTAPVNEVIAHGTKAPELNCPNGTYVNSAGNTVCSPYSSSSAPSGATAQCQDGSYSFSQSRSGTCSHHGGVASWL
jgi:hypothetical protein